MPDICKEVLLRLLLGTVAELVFCYTGEVVPGSMVGCHPRYGRVGLLVVVFLGKAGTGMRNDPGVNQYAR